MKVTPEVFESIKADIKIVLNHFLPNNNKPFSDFSTFNFFDTWHIVYANRAYPDTNKNVVFVDGKRLLEYTPNFEYYPCDTNDATLLTAIKSAVKDIVK